MKIPDKLTPEALAQRQALKRAGFNGEFWRLLKEMWREDTEAIYKSMASADNEKELFRLQGQLRAYQKILGEDAQFIIR